MHRGDAVAEPAYLGPLSDVVGPADNGDMAALAARRMGPRDPGALAAHLLGAVASHGTRFDPTRLPAKPIFWAVVGDVLGNADGSLASLLRTVGLVFDGFTSPVLKRRP